MSEQPTSPKPRGRPRVYPGTEKRPTLTFRVRGTMHEQLQQSAEASGRSLSEEIERRLEASFEHEGFIAVVQRMTWANAVDEWRNFQHNAVGGELNFLIGLEFAGIIARWQTYLNNMGRNSKWDRAETKRLLEEKAATEMLPTLLAQLPAEPGAGPHPDDEHRRVENERTDRLHKARGMRRVQSSPNSD